MTEWVGREDRVEANDGVGFRGEPAGDQSVDRGPEAAAGPEHGRTRGGSWRARRQHRRVAGRRSVRQGEPGGGGFGRSRRHGSL